MLLALRIGLDTLRANPLRALLSTLGVVIGVASLVAVLSLGDGMARYGEAQIRGEGMHVVALSPVESEAVDGVTVRRDAVVRLTSADAAALAPRLPAGTQVLVQRRATGLVARPGGGRERGAHLLGLLPADGAPPLDVVHGRRFTAVEAMAGAPVALLSAALADSLAAPAAGATLVGAEVRIGAATRRVVGIVRLPAAPGPPGARGGANLAVLPVDGLDEALAGRGAGAAAGAATLEAHAADVAGVPAVRAAVEAWAAARWGAAWREQVRVSSTGERRLAQLHQSVRVFQLFMGAIVSISLVVGGVGIMNVLLASVTERTREIGIRKTTGARDRDILRQFLAESVVVSGAGSLLGLVLGIAAAFALTAAIRALTEAEVYAAVSARTLLVAVAAALVVGLTFGTYPARRAARLSPIDAIRHE